MKLLFYETCERSRSFCFSSRSLHTRSTRDWSSDVCSSDLEPFQRGGVARGDQHGDALRRKPRDPATQIAASNGVEARECLIEQQHPPSSQRGLGKVETVQIRFPEGVHAQLRGRRESGNLERFAHQPPRTACGALFAMQARIVAQHFLDGERAWK